MLKLFQKLIIILTVTFMSSNVLAYTMTNSDCLVINSFHEASIASDREKMLVNSVVINRSTLNGMSYCKTIFQKGQFSWTQNYKFKTKFKSFNDMLTYYDISDEAFKLQKPMVAEAILVHSVIDYDNHTVKKIPVYYHDNTIKKFDWESKGSQSKLGVSTKTKYFTFYYLKKVKVKNG